MPWSQTRWPVSIGGYQPPIGAKRRKPSFSTYLTMNPISSICEASMTLKSSPRLTAIRFPRRSS